MSAPSPLAAPSPADPAFEQAVRRGLVILTLINLLNYVDRYVIAALVETLKTKAGLSLTDTEAGLLPMAFIVVYMITSGIFGSISDRRSRPRLIAFGVAVWSLATAVGGFAAGFVSLLAARALVGVGEGAYGTIAPSLLADYFPRALRGRVFSIFFAAIPVGAALGYILGGWADGHVGWRAAFFLAGVPGLVLAWAALWLPDPPRGCQDDEGAPHPSPTAVPRGWAAAYAPLFRNRPYLLTILGYTAATFAAGGLAYWMPAFLIRVRGATAGEATKQFGGITVVAGLLGTYFGGVLGDRLLRKTRHAYLWFSGVTTCLAAPLVWLALTLESPPLYIAAIVVGELLLFASTGPINSAIVNVVPSRQRVAAVALSILSIHLLGDAASPFLIGAVSDASSLGKAVLMVPVAVAVAGVIWTLTAWRAERKDRASPPPGPDAPSAA